MDGKRLLCAEWLTLPASVQPAATPPPSPPRSKVSPLRVERELVAERNIRLAGDAPKLLPAGAWSGRSDPALPDLTQQSRPGTAPMNVRSTSALLLLILLCALAPCPAFAQKGPNRPSDWPNTEAVVQQFLASRQSVAISTAIGTCPQHNPYGDSVWTALLSFEPTDFVVTRLGTRWENALLTCNDARIERWYRDRLRERRTLLWAGPVLTPLLNLRTPENLEFMKAIAFGETHDEELRAEILRRLSYASTWPERMELYFEAHERTRRLPRPFDYNAFHELARSPVGGRFLDRALEAVERQPRNPNAARLLLFIATDPQVRQTPRLRARVRATLLRIEANRDRRYPAELVEEARARREDMDANP
jgi:hypothetical protein